MALLPPCPCVMLLDIGHIREHAPERARGGPPTCRECREEAQSTAESSKKGRSSAKDDKKSTGRAISKSGGGKHKGASDSAPAPTSATMVCLTCMFSGCEDHAESHFRNVSRSFSGGKANKASSSSRHCQHHSVFLNLLDSQPDSHCFVLRCFNCDVVCGNATSADIDGDDPVGQMDGHTTNAAGYLMYFDDNTQLTEIADTAYQSVMGTMDKDALTKAERSRGSRNKNKSYDPEQHQARKAEKQARAQELRVAGMIGLQNMGNTCFFNSVLQCLLHSGLFVLALDSVPEALIPGPLTRAVAATHHHVQSAEAAATLAPKAVFAQVCQRNCMFAEYGQQDAQELFSCIINGIASEFRVRGSQDMCPASNVFGGTLRTTIQCHGCRRESSRTQPFFDLSAPIRGSIEESLAAMLAPEILSGDDAYACENCHREQFLALEAARRQRQLDEDARARELCTAPAVVVQDEVRVDASSSDDEFTEEDEDDAECSPETLADDSTPRRSDTSARVNRQPADENGVAGMTTRETSDDAELRLAIAQSIVATAAAAAPVSGATVSTPAAPPPAASPGHVRQEATITVSLHDLRSTLVVHLKRFAFNARRMQWEKDSRRVAFAAELDAAQWIAPSLLPPSVTAPVPLPPVVAAAAASAASSSPPVYIAETAQLRLVFPNVPVKRIRALLEALHGDASTAAVMLSEEGVDAGPAVNTALPAARRAVDGRASEALNGGRAAAAMPPPQRFRLVGVVEHRGTCDGGHYVAYVVSATTGKWYLCNDSTVDNVSLDTVLRSEPYLLFYERS